MMIYYSLFHRIVDKINNSIGQDPDAKSLIGVLDIYGFESFKTNRCSSNMCLGDYQLWGLVPFCGPFTLLLPQLKYHKS